MGLYEERRKKRAEKYGVATSSKREKSTVSSSESKYLARRKERDTKYPKSNVDDTYISNFLRDAQSYLSSAKTDYQSITSENKDTIYSSRKNISNDLRTRSSNIRQYLENNKDAVGSDSYNSLKSQLDDFDKENASIAYAFYKAHQFYSKFADENAYNAWQQDNANALKYGTMTAEELKEAEEAQGREYDAELQHLQEMYDGIYNSDSVNPYALETWYTDYSTSAPEKRTDPETDARNLALYNELRGEFESFEAIADRIAELKGKKRALDKSVAYTLSDGTKVTWDNLYDNAYRQKYQGKTYEQLNEIISSLEDGEEKSWLTAYAPSVMTAQDYDNEISSIDSKLQAMQAELGQLTHKSQIDSVTPEEIERAHYLQEEIKNLSQKKDRLDNERKYDFLYQNQDFKEKSGYASTAAEDWLSKTFSQYNLGYSDLTYEYINNRDGIRDKIRHEATTYRNSMDDFEIYDHLTETEAATYNYLYSTEGKKSAQEYLEYLEPTLNARKQGKTRQQAATFATEHPFLADVTSVGATLTSGVGVLDALGQKIKNDVTGDYYKPIDMNTDAMTASIISSTIRGTRAQNLADKYGIIQIDEEDHPVLSRLFNGKSLGDVYQLGMSMVDSTATALLSPVLGPASTLLLAGSSATQTMLSAAENGATDEQALWMGALSGAFEYLFEKYELESLLKNGSESAVRALVSQGLSEGFGEGMTTVSNLVADTLIMADKSELNRTIEAYREQHPDWSEEKLRNEALKDLAIQTGWDVVGGMVSGGIMGGGYSAINKGIDKIHSLAQEKVDAEQQALQQLVTDKLQAEQRALAEERGLRYKVSAINQSILQLVDRVKKGLSSASDKVQLNPVSDDIASRIQEITGVDVRGFGVAIEARQIEHILKDHGENGASDQSMANPEDIAKIQYALENPDAIRPAGSTRAYVTNKNGKMKPADTVLYEKQNGDGSYYVVQAVPDTKKKTLYIVTAFIGKSGYKNMEAPQSTNANSPGATPAAESAVASNNSISQSVPGVNDEFSSLQGKTILMSENREVSVKKFTGFTDGNATVKLADGTEAVEKDISFADEAENILFHFIAREDGMTPSAANAIWSLWEANKQSAAPVPAAAFRDSAFAVWRAGVRGDETILNAKDSRASALTAQQKEIIYEAGRKAVQDSTNAAQKKVDAVYEQAEAVLQQKGKTSSKTYRAVATRGVYVKDMSPTQRASFLLAQKIAPAVKADIEVYNGGKEWGYYNPRTDKICLNINAKWNGQTMMAFTLAHELLHRTKRGSPAQYKAFADFLVKKFGEQGSDITAMVAQQMEAADAFDKTVPENQRIHMTEDMAFEEVVADACQRMLLDTDAGKQLAEFGAQSEQNRSFLKRFAKWLRELLENLRNVFQDVTPDSLAAQEFAKFEENVKQTLADMFVKMNIDAGEKLSTIKEAGLTEKITTANGGVKYKLSYDEAIQRLDDGTLNRSDNTHLKLLDKTPELYIKKAGANNLKIIMAWDVAFLAMRKNGDIPGNYHGLGKEIMLRIPTAIENPLYIIKQNNGRIAAITEIVVKGKKPVLVSIELDAYKATKQDGAFEDDNYNLIVTVMDAQPNYLKNTVFSGDVVYNKNNEAPAHFILRLKSLNKALPNDDRTRASSGRSTPTSERSAPIAEGYGKIASTDSIRNSEQNVNENFEELVGSPKKIPVNKAGEQKNSIDNFEFVDENGNTQNATRGEQYDNRGIREGIAQSSEGTRFDRGEHSTDDEKSFKNKEWRNLSRSVQEKTSKTVDDHINNSPNSEEIYLYILELVQTEDADMSLEIYNEAVIQLTEKIYNDALNLHPVLFENKWRIMGGSISELRRSILDSASEKSYKLPVSKDVSDRAMLVDMFEQMVTDSNEYKVLQNYKSHMDEMLALEEKVERLTAEIGRLSFAEGPRDTEYLNNLKLQKKQAINRLNYYDNKLLGLEKSGVLKAMIERNRQKVTQESFDRAKAYYKERNERREADIRQYYRESRRKAIERHDMAEVRQQIRKDIQRLDSLLNKGTKNKNVKLGLQEFVGSALRLAKGTFLTDYNEYDMIRSGLQNKLLPEEQAAFNRCRELLQELDNLPEEPGPDSIHEKWDPEQAIRRDDREEALKKELAKNMRVLRDGNVFQRERAGAEQATAEELTDELLRVYQKLAESEYEHLQGLYSQKVYEQIDTVKQFLSGKAMKDMTSVELKELRKLYKMVSETVSRADELFGEHRNEKISRAGDLIENQLKTDRDKDISAAVNKLKEFGWSLLTPEAAAAVIGAERLTQAIREIEATETVQAENLEHAKRYAAEQMKKYHRDQWDTSKKFEFAGTEITLGQAMALFAYTERKAGRDHISGDGFVHSKEVPIKQKWGKLKINLKFIKDTTRAYRVTEDMYTELGKLLKEEQKGYVRAMRDYLAETMGAKGNVVSRELYGIDMYGEKLYYPLKSAKNFLDSALGAKRGEVKVTNQGFTKQLQEGASNAIVLEDFESVWARHVQEMSNYHACAVAMENFNRLYNYRRTEQRQTTDKWGQLVTEEVKSSEPVSLHIERRAPGATGYLVKWMESVNGGVRSDAIDQLLGGPLGHFRKTAVLGNLSVIVQQPTAILRAAPYLGKDFLAGWKTWKTTKTPEKGLIREMYRYCPVAVLKKMGGFDPSAGQTVRQYLFDGRDDGKGKLRKGLDKTNEVLGWAPEKADELAWSYLWLSCKKKTLRENKGLRAGSKEHCQAASELFTQIVRETQVYDSVMSKPLIMQSKNMAVKGLTSFMNEPLKGLNQCITAVARQKNGEISKTEAVQHISSVLVSNLLAKAISCLIYALRDDEEEKTYGEKYLKHFAGGLLDIINPLNSVPGIKEIFSIIQGYGNERSEFAAISDAVAGIRVLIAGIDAETPEEFEKEVWDKLEKGLGSILTLFSGVPVSNLIREIRGIYYTIKRAGSVEATDAGTRYALQEGFTGKDVSNAEQLYNAVVEDDGIHLTRVMSTWENPKTAVSNLVSAVKDAYLDGKITDDRATEYLHEFGEKAPEDISDYLAEWEFKKKYPDSALKDSKAVDYIELAAPAGINLETYTQYVKKIEGLTSEKDKDGNPIPGSKLKKVVNVIHALPLTRRQKDALYLAEGYAESKLDETPWN